MAKFTKLNLSKNVLDAIKSIGFSHMTPIQENVIPLGLKNKNLIGASHTGSGKTHSFLIPLFNNLEKINKLQYIILCPTRELSRQVFDEAIKFEKFIKSKANIQLVVGGTDKEKSLIKFKNNISDVIVGTPGRINDIFISNKLFNLKFVKTLIIDEADMIFDLGFRDELITITSALSKSSFQLFSATVPKVLKDYIKKFVKNINIIEIDKGSYNNKNIIHNLLNIKHKEKMQVVSKAIEIQKPFLAIVFVNTKIEVEKLVNILKKYSKKVVGLHGKLESRVRKNIIVNIRNKKYDILVATDIAARGIDIEDVSHVYSLNVPFDPKYYIHRSGRTGRAGKTGQSLLLWCSDDIKAISKLTSYNISFNHLEIKNDTIIKIKKRIPKFGNKEKSQEDKEVLAIIATTKSKIKKKGVKPGYRKKLKEEVRKIRHKKIRAKIKANIKLVKKQKAKEKQSKLKLINK